MSKEWDAIAPPVPACEQLCAGWVCPACGMVRERDNGPDPCIGELPGVEFACCGHGGVPGATPFGSGYIAFSNGVTVRFLGAAFAVDQVRNRVVSDPRVVVNKRGLLKKETR